MNSPDGIDLVVSHNQEASDAALRIVDSVEAQGCFAWAYVKAFYSPLVSAERQIAKAFSRARVICLFVGDRYRDTRWRIEANEAFHDVGQLLSLFAEGEPGCLALPRTCENTCQRLRILRALHNAGPRSIRYFGRHVHQRVDA